MSTTKTFALLGLATLLLAGCSSAPPTGTLVSTGYTTPGFTGTANVVYTPFSNGGNPTGGVPVVGGQLQCAQDPVFGQIPPGTVPPGQAGPCVPASTKVHANFTLPAAGTESYKLYFVGGTGGEAEIGDLTAVDGKFTVAKVYGEDLNGKHTGLELRLSGVVVARASAAAGSQTFTLEPVSGIQVQATYEGAKLTAKISGLQPNGTYLARLYTKDAATGNTTAVEMFPVANGDVTFTSKQKASLAEYAEFHIHVGGSSLNLYKAEFKPNA